MRWLRWIFPWRTVRDNGAWLYQEHSRTGERRAIHRHGAGYQPVNSVWLNGGEVIR